MSGAEGERRARRGRRVDFDIVRRLALELPGVEEGTSYGTPAFRVCGKLIARAHQDGDSLVLRSDLDEREALLRADPAVFHSTDHYVGHPWVLVRLSAVRAELLAELLEGAWRRLAPNRLVAELDAAR